MVDLIPFPDRSAILVDRSPFGGFEVEPHLCPLAAGKGRSFTAIADALDYAEDLARTCGTGVFVMCDLGNGGHAA